MIFVREAEKTKADCDAIIWLARLNPRCAEYDVSFDEFTSLFPAIFMMPDFRVWLLCNPEVIGYVAAVRNKLLTDEIYIFDTFILPPFRGLKNSRLLLESLLPWVRESKPKHVRGDVNRYSKAWERLLKVKLSKHLTLSWEVE